MTVIIIIIAFMHGIYNRVPAINHVSRVYNIADTLRLQIMVHVTLCFTRTFM
jgi:hypothetical protein